MQDEEDPSALTPGTVLAGRFRVMRCLGVGGMGAVYEIEHELTKHRRALKLLHAAMAANAGVVERFLREASAAGRVGNPHIVETFDAGTLDTGEPYLVMEMLRGETLSDRIARGPMPVAEMVDLIGQASEGVQAAHEAGIVHRDLKPDNLFVMDVEGRPFVKILDFGISKFDPGKTGGMALTQEGAALGTPYYMSPEQIRGETSLDARTDVYALGVILYECAASVRPFEADALTQLAVLIHTGRPKPLAELRPDLPAGFAEVVGHAMATDKDQRIQSARGLRLELERYGAISFRTQSGVSRMPSVPAQRPSAVPAIGLATSAAGVSVAPARQAGKGQQGGAIAVGLGIVAVAALGGFYALRSGHAADAEASAVSSASAGAVPTGSPVVSPSPPPVAAGAAGPTGADVSATPAGASPPPGAPVPTPRSIAPARTAPAPYPVVAPTLQPPVVAGSLPPVTHGSAPAAAASAPPPKKVGRSEAKGLAQDNPFK